MKATIIMVIVIVALAAGNIYSIRENGKLSESITGLNDKIETQKGTIEELQADIDLRQKVNDQLVTDKLGLMEDKEELFKENQRILMEGPKIIETVKVIENVRYVDLSLVEKKVDQYYQNLYNRLGTVQ